jgi:2-polyprenyl-3-methyl-5-hydroxy-6-metoxy-1,4-benzoquinol methylase
MDTAPSPPLDPARAQAFAASLLDTLNRGALCLMLSVGHRTGLFDAMAGRGPLTPAELATVAGLQERYVREWLGAMATGRVVEAGADGRFTLPAEHAASLVRAAGADNVAVFAQYIAELGSVEGDIVRCFREGGGVPYARFPRFHEVMAEDSGQSVLAALEGPILGLVPGLRERLEAGVRVLDAGCGRGRALLQLARLFPKSRFHGMDLSEEATARATAEAQALGLLHVRFTARDLSDFDETAEPAAYDVVFTFDAVHDQARPSRLLRGIRRTLAEDGVYVMQDIHGHTEAHQNLAHPLGPFLYAVSCMHCMTVSLVQGGEGLGAMWGREQAEARLREAGFSRVEVHRLAHDIQNDWYVVRP